MTRARGEGREQFLADLPQLTLDGLLVDVRSVALLGGGHDP
jgi:hypothetical protein